MSKEVIKGLIDLIPEEDEILAILEAKADSSPTVSHEDIDWE